MWYADFQLVTIPCGYANNFWKALWGAVPESTKIKTITSGIHPGLERAHSLGANGNPVGKKSWNRR